jgi:hypothetical protein
VDLAHEKLKVPPPHPGIQKPKKTTYPQMTKSSIAKFCAVAAGLLLPSVSWAGETVASKEVVKNVVEEIKESCISGDIGINITSQYVSRGLIFENQGAIIQPYADLYFKLYEGTGFLTKMQLNLGIWNSFHSRKTDAGSVTGAGTASTRSWYEFDFTAGISFTFAEKLTFTPSYYTFLSPNDGFSTFQGLNLKLAYDDSSLWGDSGFALNPWVQVLFELENKAGNGSDEGIYYEVGIAPSFTVGPVGVSVPITAGFGSNDFYGDINGNNEAFGYVSAGVNLSYTLPFIPECYGSWAINGAATYYYLGDALDDYNTAARGGSVRDGSHHEWVFSGGLVVTF